MPHPPLHDLVSAVAAPAAVLSDASGNLGLLGAQGAYVADRRILSVCEVSVHGHALIPLSHTVLGGPAVTFVSVCSVATGAVRSSRSRAGTMSVRSSSRSSSE